MARDRRFIVEYARMLANRVRRRLRECQSVSCLLTALARVYRTIVNDLGPDDARSVMELVLDMVERPDWVDPDTIARLVSESEMYRDLAPVLDLIVRWAGGRPPRIVVALSVLREVRAVLADVENRLATIVGRLEADVTGGLTVGLLDLAETVYGFRALAVKPSILSGMELDLYYVEELADAGDRIVDAARVVSCIEGHRDCVVTDEDENAVIEDLRGILEMVREARGRVEKLISFLMEARL